jgi:signal transduction histidine kinase
MDSKMKKTNLKSSIQIELIKKISPIYFFVALVVTFIHVTIEFLDTKNSIIEELGAIEVTHNKVLSKLMWHLNQDQLKASLNGIVKMPLVVGVSLKNQKGHILLSSGNISITEADVKHVDFEGNIIDVDKKVGLKKGLFKKSFNLERDSLSDKEKIGEIILYSNNKVIFKRVGLGFIFIIFNAIIKTTVLWVVFIYYTRKIVSEPLNELTNETNNIKLNQLEAIEIKGSPKNEIGILQSSFNKMIYNLTKSRDDVKKQTGINIDILTTYSDELEKEVIKRTDELKGANRDLKEINNRLNRFIAIVAHDLRNPIGAIHGYIFILTKWKKEKKVLQEGKEEKILKNLDSLCSRSINLIKDILEIGALGSGSLEIEWGSSTAKEIGALTIENIKFFAEKKSINLIWNLEEGFQIKSDKNRIIQVLTNLLTNAVKFTPENGAIELNIFQIGEDKKVQFEVKDNGNGVESDIIEHLFDKDHLTTRKGTDGEAGTGFGLPLCQDLIIAHNSKILVESKMGEGSRFFFILEKFK